MDHGTSRPQGAPCSCDDRLEVNMTTSSSSSTTDETVVEDFLKDPGSDAAARAFEARFGNFLRSAAQDAADLVERDLVDDVVQTAMCSLMEGARTYRRGGNPRAFLRYLIRDAAKKTRREQPWVIGPPPRQGPSEARPQSPVVRRWIEPSPAANARVDREFVPTHAVRELAPRAHPSLAETGDEADEVELRSTRRPLTDPDPTQDVALLRVERDRILTAALKASSSLAAPTLVGIAAGAPWTRVGEALGRDPATLRYAVNRVAADLAA